MANRLEVPQKTNDISPKEIIRKEELIDADIVTIDEALESGTSEKLISVHRDIDCKYQAVIIDWGKSMYGLNHGGFIYETIGDESLKNNLSSMKSKLTAFKRGLNVKKDTNQNKLQNNINLAVNNTIGVTLSVQQTLEQIQNMTALSQEETKEIEDKIMELDKISKEKLHPKAKWEKIKPIIQFALDKGVDVGIAVLSLVLQMKLTN